MRRHVLLFLLAVLLLVSLVGCQAIPDLRAPEHRAGEAPAAQPPEQSGGNPINPDFQAAVTGGKVPFPATLADVVAKVTPSVVAITTEVVTYDFFNRPFTQTGGGTGWIISPDGVIVTNNHVVEGARAVTVKLHDGSIYEVDLSTIAADPLSDLAVFRIDADGLTPAVVGDSGRMQVGDWVLAIGNSLGEGIRASVGIVSRQVPFLQSPEGQILVGLIETDAAINPGNSGGPLVNLAGEVVGINTIKSIRQDVDAVGWAISMKTALPIITQLIRKGKASHPYLGVSLYTVDQGVAEQFNLPVTEGALVTSVQPGSPADRAGLREGDVIIAAEGQETPSAEAFVAAIRSSDVGEKLTMRVVRGDRELTLSATLIERPD